MKKILPILVLVAACGPKSAPKQPVDHGTATGGATYGDAYGYGDEADGDDAWGYGYGYGGDTYGYGGDAYGYSYTPPPPQPPNIVGTWASACGAGPAGDYLTLTFVNTATDWDLNVAVFGDAGCAKRKSLVHVAGTYTFGAQSTTVTDAWEGTFSFTKREVTIDDKKGVKAFQKLCGVKKVKPGKPVDILAKGCPKMGFKPVADCPADNDIVSVDSVNLRFGVRPADNDLCTADKRPTALQTSIDIVYANGLPACDAMIADYDRLANCPKAATVKDSMLQAEQAMKDSWGDLTKLDAATKRAWNDACKQALDGLNTTISSMGC